MENYIKEIKNLVEQNKRLNQELLFLKAKYSNLGLNQWDKVYMEYLTVKGGQRYVLGYVRKETTNHVKISIWDKKEEMYWSYIIHKDQIKGVKLYAYDPNDDFLQKLKNLKEERDLEK